MLKLSISEMLQKIEAEETFEAVSEDYSFTIKIDDYVHHLCGAVHDGHQFRRELWEEYLHTEYDRWYEEDPCTKAFVETHPIVIAGCDSRFEYDLNRPPEGAVYEDAWGKTLWRTTLPEAQKQKSLEKHANFYKVVHALVSKIESLFGVAIVYDMHSYNWKRWEREVPVINLGTSNIDNDRFGNEIESWRYLLSTLVLPNGIESTAKINDTFFGNGYFLKYITHNFDNTLVLATEFKKIYCDEINQVLFPEVVHAIEKQLRTLLPQHAEAFYSAHRK